MAKEDRVSLGLIAVAFFILLLMFFATRGHATTKPIAIYKYTGTFISYVDPQDPDTVREAWVLQDHTQVETSGPVEGYADPIHELYVNDRRKDYQSASNGFKVHVVGYFQYRESSDTDGTPTLCVPTGKLEPSIPVEACYLAFPRDPSILDAPQRPGTNKKATA